MDRLNNLAFTIDRGHKLSWDMAYGSQTSYSTATRPQEDQEGIKPSHSRAQSIDHHESIFSSVGGANVINNQKTCLDRSRKIVFILYLISILCFLLL